MSHDFKRQSRAGALVVRVSTAQASGLGVMVMDDGDQGDEFVNDAGAVILSATRRGLGRVFTPARGEYRQVEALLATDGVRQATRAYSARSVERMLARPTASWSWDRRATVLYRLDTTWALVESMGHSCDLALLRSDQPLGQIADLVYESFDSDLAYRDQLESIDMAAAGEHYARICARMRCRVLR